MAFFGPILLLILGILPASSISLTDHSIIKNKNLFPASRLVDLKLYHVDDNRQSFERKHLRIANDNPLASFSAMLKRRDGLTIYGKDIVYGSEEPNYATLSIQHLRDGSISNEERDSECGWEATLLLTPEVDNAVLPKDDSCFVAMNRFAVKQGCEYLFEQRWAERISKLSCQPGFISFCLIRKRQPDNMNTDESNEVIALFNYSSLTLWRSFESWTAWREGDGRYSHDASRILKRTPVSEWLEHSASPIFWDGIGTVLDESGV